MYIINRYEGFNDIRFGMLSQEIEERLKLSPRRFYKDKEDKFETDAYNDFFIYYDAEGKCEAVEFNNNAILFLNEINLFEESYQKIEQLIKKADLEIEIDDVGFTSNKLGIGVYAPFKYETNAIIESIIIFRRGYYVV